MKQTNPTTAAILIDAADELKNGFGDPDTFFEFLIDALGWVHAYELNNNKYENGKDPHFALGLLLREVYWAWENNIPVTDPNAIPNALAKVVDVFGGTFLEIIPGLIAAYAHDMDTTGYPSHTTPLRDFKGMRTLLEVGHYLADYYERENKKAA